MSSQLDEMNQLYMAMRGWRHDYHNHMQKIRAHLALGEYGQVKEYITNKRGFLPRRLCFCWNRFARTVRHTYKFCVMEVDGCL